MTPSPIDPRKLSSWLEMERRGGGASILLLDVRTREAYESERIDASNSACIEPTVLLRSQIDAQGLESALVVSPDNEEKAFNARAGFKFVVMYDDGSSSVSGRKELGALFKVMVEDVSGRKTTLPPMLLVGGLKEWKKELGTTGLIGRSIPARQRSMGKVDPSPERAEKADRRRAHVRDGAVFEPCVDNLRDETVD